MGYQLEHHLHVAGIIFIFVEEGLQLLCMDLFCGARCQLKQ